MNTHAVQPLGSPRDGPIELAQAQVPGQSGAGEAIGQVSAVEGAVTITHPDGSKVTATAGTPVFQGDLVETAATGAIGITFADDSTFSLAEKGSMVIDQMVYDPASQTGKSAITVAEGVFTFVSGQIAKTEVDAMLIKTPVAVIGIRGTAGGGKAGPEGTPNTISMFVDPKGPAIVGEMVVKSLGGGGEVVLSRPLQTTQVVSAFVPPIKPITLPPQVAQQFYAKATGAAPTKPGFAPTGPTGDQGGPTGDPQQTGPDGDQPAGPADDQQPVGPAADVPSGAINAAADAFEQALAGGQSLDAAINAAVNTAVGAELQNALAVNPNVFGSLQAGDAIINGIVDKVFVGVTGNFDPLSAGTGKGAGFNEVVGTFFQNEIGAVLGTGLADLDIGPNPFGFGFGDPFGPGFGDPFGPGFGFDDPFAFGFDDPFGFDFFGFGDVLFAGAGEFFFLESGDIFLFGDDDVTFIGDVETTIFDEVLLGSSGNDTLTGTALNTNFFMGQDFTNTLGSNGGFLGGADTVDGGGGVNQLTFDDLDDVTFTLMTSASILNAGSISYSGTNVSGSVTYTDIQQFLFADVPNSLSGGFISGSDTTAGDSGDTIVFPGLELAEVGKAFVGGSGNDIITVDNGGSPLDGALVFGKGGGDTINVNVATDGLLIGGFTNTDNVDGTGNDGIADANLNVFDYSAITTAILTGLSATGLQVNLIGTDLTLVTGGANFGGDGLVRDFNVNDSNHLATLNNNLLDVAHFIGSQGDDQIIVNGGPSGGGFAIIDGDVGNDSIQLTNGARIGTIDGGEDGDSYDLGAGLTFSGTVNVVNDSGTVGTDTATVRIVDGTANITPTITAVEQITVSVEALGSPTYNGTNAPAAQSYGAQFTSDGNTLTLNNIDTPNFAVNGTTLSGVIVTFINAGGVTATGGNGNDSFTGFTGADTLNGGAGNDTLNGRAGDDTLTGNTGGDTLIGDLGADALALGASDGATDIVRYISFNDGSAGGVAAGTFTGFDTITEFDTAAQDLVNFFQLGLNGTTAASVASGGINTNATTDGVFFINNATAASLADVDTVITALGAITTDANDKFIVLVQNGGGDTGIYAYTEDGTISTATAAVAGQLQMLALVSAANIDNGDVAVTS